MTPRKPRKMPKNQRAYPKGKPRLAEITHDQSLQLANSDIGAPVVYFDKGKYYVNADQMRKWRGSRVTSAVASNETEVKA